MLTSDVTRDKNGMLLRVERKTVSERLKRIRIPPAWKNVMVDPDADAVMVATGIDAKGRRQYIYSPEHLAESKHRKFAKIRKLIEEHEDIRSEIEQTLNNKRTSYKDREAALVAYLIYETGIRPGSNTDTLADVQAYGATTLQLRHVKLASNGVRLKFIGKKGVAQNVLVTNPYLVNEIRKRKMSTTAYTTLLFDCSSTKLRQFVGGLGSNAYTPKDLRTMRGTILAMELIGWRVRIPSTKKGKKEIVNTMLDKVAKQLGNTRAVTRSAYVDPAVYSRFVN